MTTSSAADVRSRTVPTFPSSPPGSGGAPSWLAGGPRFDAVSITLSCWVMAGLFLDGWAHEYQPQLESFFTPWHTVLYSGALAQMGFLGVALGRNRARGRPWRSALPAGHELSLVGAGIFLLAGLGDFAWHAAFGIEASVAALLSPPHLALASGLGLMLTGPARAAWLRPNLPAGWAAQLPLLVSVALLLALLGFFTGYGHPFTGVGLVVGQPPGEPELRYSYQARGILGILLQSGLLMGALLPLVLRPAGALPFGGLTLVLGLNGLLPSALGGTYAVVLAAVVAGMAADVLLRWLRPCAGRRVAVHMFAFAVPATLYGAYFATLGLFVGHVWWAVHLWVGAIALAGLVGLLVSCVVLLGDGEQPPIHPCPSPRRPVRPNTPCPGA